MKGLSLVGVALLVVAGAFAQQRTAPESPAAPAPPKLSDPYSKAALLALKAIQSEGSRGEVRGGQILVPRRTFELIEAADREGITAEEKGVTSALHSVFIQKLTNNAARYIILRNNESMAQLSMGRARYKLRASELTEKDPDVLEINRREGACFAALEAMLRARSSSIPEACSDMALVRKEEEQKK